MSTSLSRICLSLAGIFVAGSLFAGPMPAEKNVTPMAPAPECTWTGFYIGGNVGITEFYARVTDDNDFEDLDVTRTFDTGAFIGGGQIGYNYQMGHLVFGVEADASGSTAEIRKDQCYENDCGDYSYGYHENLRVDFLATLRGRIGVSLDDNKVLLYGTAGGAYAHGKWDEYYFYYHGYYGNYYDADWKGDDWRWGWTAGFGLEYKLNCRWSVRGEALLTWLSEDKTPITGPKGSGYYPSEADEYKFTFSDDLYTFRVGVNYNFGGLFGR